MYVLVLSLGRLSFIACDEAYHGNSRHLFACQTGCNVTTIDQQIANRDQIYPVQTNTSEVSFVFELLATIKHQLSPQFMVVNTELDQLTQHAENMYQYLPCSEVTSFVLIEDNVSYYTLITTIYEGFLPHIHVI